MAEPTVVIMGLPASGKTTFLAALWHLLTEGDIETALRLQNLLSGDMTHLNAIAARWRDARMQERTSVSGNRLVSMNLTRSSGQHVRVVFPDVAGEAYRRMWEERACDPEVADLLRAEGVLLCVHADDVRRPGWVVDEVDLHRRLGLPMPEQDVVTWHPRFAPTQVQLVSMLQLLCEPPLAVGPRKLAVTLSAWDKVEAEASDPAGYLDGTFPLLSQYLRGGKDGWDWRVHGLSAQGGDYDPSDEEGGANPEAERLRELDRPSDRIRVVTGGEVTHDLTGPLEWLMG